MFLNRFFFLMWRKLHRKLLIFTNGLKDGLKMKQKNRLTKELFSYLPVGSFSWLGLLNKIAPSGDLTNKHLFFHDSGGWKSTWSGLEYLNLSEGFFPLQIWCPVITFTWPSSHDWSSLNPKFTLKQKRPPRKSAFWLEMLNGYRTLYKEMLERIQAIV